MDKDRQTLAEQACDKALKRELDHGCCPRCAQATGTVPQWVVQMPWPGRAVHLCHNAVGARTECRRRCRQSAPTAR